MLDSTGKTSLRVDVPFNRPAGEQVAAVAGLQGPDTVSPIDGGAFDKLRNEAGRAFALLQGLYQDGRQPTVEELAAARSATAIALNSLSEYRLPAGANASAQAIVEAAVAQAAEAAAALDQLPPEPEAVGSQLAGITSIIEQAVGPVIAEAPGGDLAPSPVPETAEAGPKTIAQAPLTHTNNSVIIRRGDTLWQISRRVYGQGVRYTTIYLANEGQIKNPDMIEPGQIFGVPDEALPDAEELHRKRLQKQQL
jgi:nucleoid-associated protein YgaU